MNAIIMISWCIVALVAFVCIDVATSLDPRETAWIWFGLPSFFGLLALDVFLLILAKLTGAWRFGPYNPESPVYSPTVIGRALLLLSCRLKGVAAAHPLAPAVMHYTGRDFVHELTQSRERQLAEAVGDHKWRDVKKVNTR